MLFSTTQQPGKRLKPVGDVSIMSAVTWNHPLRCLPGQSDDEGEAPSKDPLGKFAVDLVERARQGRIDPLIGRDFELERIMQVLCRRRKNNPLFVGDAGVGKTALA